jgi:hypothetical protein
MTPEELIVLFAPFVLNWVLIWLTNESEKVAEATHAAPQGQGMEDDKPEQPSHEIQHSRFHKRRRQVEASTGELLWNVSNFFGLKQATG